MKLGREARRSDPLGRYYTDSVIGQQLVAEMNLPKPKTVVDLGAGSGILSHEASKVWKNSSFITVDIDDRASSSQFPVIHGSNFKHHVGDALELGLPDRLGLGSKKVDAAICNPPYLLPKWRKHFGDILDDAGLGRFVPKAGDMSADILFIAQNLRLLNNGGKLGLILPDGIVSGEKYQLLRHALIDMHCIEKVVELPRRAFKRTDAKAHIVVLSKNASCNEYIPVSRLNADGSLSKTIMAPAEDFSKRLDYSYLEGKKNWRGTVRIGDVSQVLYRGGISSSEIRTSKIPVFHTTDFDLTKTFVDRKFHLTKRQESQYNGPVAVEGDILIARVGRNLSQKVCMVKYPGKVAVSDCVIVLRIRKNHIRKVFSFLTSKKGIASVESMTKGVAARYITISSVADISY